MTRNLRATALVSWTILMLGLSGQGCVPDSCVKGEGLGFVYVDWKGDRYFCDASQPREAVDEPPQPDLGTVHPADIGPKDPDAVVNAAIVMNSCFGKLYKFQPFVNWTIESMYYEYLRHRSMQALFQRTACFKDKATGCDALRECAGIVDIVNGSPVVDGVSDFQGIDKCGTDKVSYDYNNYTEDGVDYVTSTWINCAGLGLGCPPEYPREWCGAVETPCNPMTDTFICENDRPFYCELGDFDGNYFDYADPPCSDFGLMCEPQKPGYRIADCVGTGPACTDAEPYAGDGRTFHLRSGIACESETVLRACVGTGEKLVDCTTLGKGFTCIGGDKPHCGFASECDGDTPVTCEGDALVVCDGGRIRKIDCKSLGFKACDAKHNVCSPGIYDNLP